jgi:hypothetical protein
MGVFCTVPRPPLPTEKHPFNGTIHTADDQHLGRVDGLFYRGHEKSPEARWRGQFNWTGDTIAPGDSITLRRDGRDPVRLTVMTCGDGIARFRCSTTKSPL